MRNALVQDFARGACGARDRGSLGILLRETSAKLGFHHVLLQDAEGAVLLAQMPQAWPPPAADAVLAAAAQCFAPFLWSDIPRLIACTPAQQDFMDRSAATAGPTSRPTASTGTGQIRWSKLAGQNWPVKTGRPNLAGQNSPTKSLVKVRWWKTRWLNQLG